MKLNSMLKSIGVLGAAGFLAVVATPMAAEAQTVARPTTDNPFGLPAEFDILGKKNPNVRTARAVVNGFVITGTDIDQRVALVTSASNADISEDELIRLRIQVLRNLIDETLKIQAAEALEMKVEPSQVDQTYNQLAAQNFSEQPEKMEQYLYSIGSAPAALKRQIEGELAWENLLQRNVNPYVNVSAEEVNEVLKRLEESRGTEEYRLGEIYLSATIESRQSVLQNAGRILEQLRSGGSFVAYARQFSEASTAAVGGDLGWLRLAQLPPALAETAKNMQTGQLAGPIEIPGGFSILYLIEKRQVLTADPREAVLSLRQISLPFEAGMSQAEAEAKIEQFNTYISSLRSCSDADTARQAIGANVVSNDQIKVNQLPPALQNMILELQIGQTTPAFGSIEEGVRVLMLCGRDDPPPAGTPTFASIERQIEEERASKRAQRYLRDLRNDAYIEYN